MQFKVPQFIDIEDKVFGNLTFKQFAYLAGGAGFTYLTLKLLPTLIALPVAGIFIALALALAFYKYNDKPFVHTLEAFVKFYSRSRLYLWHKQDAKATQAPNKIPTKNNRGTLTESKLQTLSWSLDIIDPKK
jgi:hypothetical protein